MAKPKLNELTKDQLKELERQLTEEIKQLNNVIEASNTPVFDLLIREVKKEMQDNIAEEEWKKLKENQRKIESYRSIEKTLQNQEDLLERKEEELADVQNAIENYQPSLFEQPEQNQEIEIEGEAEETGFEDSEGNAYKTGDVYTSENEEGASEYFLVKKSAESSDKFAIISNAFDNELLLNYPKNREHLEQADFIGNIYDEENNAEALEALKIIADSQEKTEPEQEEPETVPDKGDVVDEYFNTEEPEEPSDS